MTSKNGEISYAWCKQLHVCVYRNLTTGSSAKVLSTNRVNDKLLVRISLSSNHRGISELEPNFQGWGISLCKRSIDSTKPYVLHIKAQISEKVSDPRNRISLLLYPEIAGCSVHLASSRLTTSAFVLTSGQIVVTHNVNFDNAVTLEATTSSIRLMSTLISPYLVLKAKTNVNLETGSTCHINALKAMCQKFMFNGFILPNHPSQEVKINIDGNLLSGVGGCIGKKRVKNIQILANMVDIEVTGDITNFGGVTAAERIKINCRKILSCQNSTEESAHRGFLSILELSGLHVSDMEGEPKPHDLIQAVENGNDPAKVATILANGGDVFISKDIGKNIIAADEIAVRALSNCKNANSVDWDKSVETRNIINTTIQWWKYRRGSIVAPQVELSCESDVEDCSQFLTNYMVMDIGGDMILEKESIWHSKVITGVCHGNFNVEGEAKLDKFEAFEIHGNLVTEGVVRLVYGGNVRVKEQFLNKNYWISMSDDLVLNVATLVQADEAGIIAGYGENRSGSLKICVNENGSEWYGKIFATYLEIKAKCEVQCFGELHSSVASRIIVDNHMKRAEFMTSKSCVIEISNGPLICEKDTADDQEQLCKSGVENEQDADIIFYGSIVCKGLVGDGVRFLFAGSSLTEIRSVNQVDANKVACTFGALLTAPKSSLILAASQAQDRIELKCTGCWTHKGSLYTLNESGNGTAVFANVYTFNNEGFIEGVDALELTTGHLMNNRSLLLGTCAIVIKGAGAINNFSQLECKNGSIVVKEVYSLKNHQDSQIIALHAVRITTSNSVTNHGIILAKGNELSCGVRGLLKNRGTIIGTENVYMNIEQMDNAKGLIRSMFALVYIVWTAKESTILEGIVMSQVQLKLEIMWSESFTFHCSGGSIYKECEENVPQFFVPSEGLMVTCKGGSVTSTTRVTYKECHPVIICAFGNTFELRENLTIPQLYVLLSSNKEHNKKRAKERMNTTMNTIVEGSEICSDDLPDEGPQPENPQLSRLILITGSAVLKADLFTAIGKSEGTDEEDKSPNDVGIKCVIRADHSAVFRCMEQLFSDSFLQLQGCIEITSNSKIKAPTLYLHETSICKIVRKSEKSGNLEIITSEAVTVAGKVYVEDSLLTNGVETQITCRPGNFLISESADISLPMLALSGSDKSNLLISGKVEVVNQMRIFDVKTIHIKQTAHVLCQTLRTSEISIRDVVLAGHLEVTGARICCTSDHFNQTKTGVLEITKTSECHEGQKIDITARKSVTLTGKISAAECLSPNGLHTCVICKGEHITISDSASLVLPHLRLAATNSSTLLIAGNLNIRKLFMVNIKTVQIDESGHLNCHDFYCGTTEKSEDMIQEIILSGFFNITGITAMFSNYFRQTSNGKLIINSTERGAILTEAGAIEIGGTIEVDGEGSLTLVGGKGVSMNEIEARLSNSEVTIESVNNIVMSSGSIIQLAAGQLNIRGPEEAVIVLSGCIEGPPPQADTHYQEQEPEEDVIVKESEVVTNDMRPVVVIEGYDVQLDKCTIRNLVAVKLVDICYLLIENDSAIDGCKNLEITADSAKLRGTVQNVSNIVQFKISTGMFSGTLRSIKTIRILAEMLVINSGEIESSQLAIVSPIFMNSPDTDPRTATNLKELVGGAELTQKVLIVEGLLSIWIGGAKRAVNQKLRSVLHFEFAGTTTTTHPDQTTLNNWDNAMKSALKPAAAQFGTNNTDGLQKIVQDAMHTLPKVACNLSASNLLCQSIIKMADNVKTGGVESFNLSLICDSMETAHSRYSSILQIKEGAKLIRKLRGTAKSMKNYISGLFGPNSYANSLSFGTKEEQEKEEIKEITWFSFRAGPCSIFSGGNYTATSQHWQNEGNIMACGDICVTGDTVKQIPPHGSNRTMRAMGKLQIEAKKELTANNVRGNLLVLRAGNTLSGENMQSEVSLVAQSGGSLNVRNISGETADVSAGGSANVVGANVSGILRANANHLNLSHAKAEHIFASAVQTATLSNTTTSGHTNIKGGDIYASGAAAESFNAEAENNVSIRGSSIKSTLRAKGGNDVDIMSSTATDMIAEAARDARIENSEITNSVSVKGDRNATAGNLEAHAVHLTAGTGEAALTSKIKAKFGNIEGGEKGLNIVGENSKADHEFGCLTLRNKEIPIRDIEAMLNGTGPYDCLKISDSLGLIVEDQDVVLAHPIRDIKHGFTLEARTVTVDTNIKSNKHLGLEAREGDLNVKGRRIEGESVELKAKGNVNLQSRRENILFFHRDKETKVIGNGGNISIESTEGGIVSEGAKISTTADVSLSAKEDIKLGTRDALGTFGHSWVKSETDIQGKNVNIVSTEKGITSKGAKIKATSNALMLAKGDVDLAGYSRQTETTIVGQNVPIESEEGSISAYQARVYAEKDAMMSAKTDINLSGSSTLVGGRDVHMHAKDRDITLSESHVIAGRMTSVEAGRDINVLATGGSQNTANRSSIRGGTGAEYQDANGETRRLGLSMNAGGNLTIDASTVKSEGDNMIDVKGNITMTERSHKYCSKKYTTYGFLGLSSTTIEEWSTHVDRPSLESSNGRTVVNCGGDFITTAADLKSKDGNQVFAKGKILMKDLITTTERKENHQVLGGLLCNQDKNITNEVSHGTLVEDTCSRANTVFLSKESDVILAGSSIKTAGNLSMIAENGAIKNVRRKLKQHESANTFSIGVSNGGIHCGFQHKEEGSESVADNGIECGGSAYLKSKDCYFKDSFKMDVKGDVMIDSKNKVVLTGAKLNNTSTSHDVGVTVGPTGGDVSYTYEDQFSESVVKEGITCHGNMVVKAKEFSALDSFPVATGGNLVLDVDKFVFKAAELKLSKKSNTTSIGFSKGEAYVSNEYSQCSETTHENQNTYVGGKLIVNAREGELIGANIDNNEIEGHCDSLKAVSLQDRKEEFSVGASVGFDFVSCTPTLSVSGSYGNSAITNQRAGLSVRNGGSENFTVNNLDMTGSTVVFNGDVTNFAKKIVTKDLDDYSFDVGAALSVSIKPKFKPAVGGKGKKLSGNFEANTDASIDRQKCTIASTSGNVDRSIANQVNTDMTNENENPISLSAGFGASLADDKKGKRKVQTNMNLSLEFANGVKHNYQYSRKNKINTPSNASTPPQIKRDLKCNRANIHRNNDMRQQLLNATKPIAKKIGVSSEAINTLDVMNDSKSKRALLMNIADEGAKHVGISEDNRNTLKKFATTKNNREFMTNIIDETTKQAGVPEEVRCSMMAIAKSKNGKELLTNALDESAKHAGISEDIRNSVTKIATSKNGKDFITNTLDEGAKHAGVSDDIRSTVTKIATSNNGKELLTNALDESAKHAGIPEDIRNSVKKIATSKNGKDFITNTLNEGAKHAGVSDDIRSTVTKMVNTLDGGAKYAGVLDDIRSSVTKMGTSNNGEDYITNTLDEGAKYTGVSDDIRNSATKIVASTNGKELIANTLNKGAKYTGVSEGIKRSVTKMGTSNNGEDFITNTLDGGTEYVSDGIRNSAAKMGAITNGKKLITNTLSEGTRHSGVLDYMGNNVTKIAASNNGKLFITNTLGDDAKHKRVSEDNRSNVTKMKESDNAIEVTTNTFDERARHAGAQVTSETA